MRRPDSILGQFGEIAECRDRNPGAGFVVLCTTACSDIQTVIQTYIPNTHVCSALEALTLIGFINLCFKHCSFLGQSSLVSTNVTMAH